MKRNNKSILILTALIGSMSVGAVALGASVVSTVAAYVINENSYFTYDYEGYTFNCYTIEGQGNQNKLAIAWGMDPSQAPSHVNVPSALTYNGTNYTVTAVAKAGFRYCRFETISLPNTIEEIREEAFAYCTKMTRFTLPYNVTEIAPSTFMDCRSMEYFFYSNSDGSADLLTNDKVTRIGDHAFTLCMSLVNFNCPTTTVFFGESCFQKCTLLSNFYFPSKTGTGNSVNKITVEAYAFAGCSNLKWVYFEENLDVVEPYVFTDCEPTITLHFGYYSSPFDPDTKYSTNWRKQYIYNNNSAKIPIESDHIVILQSNEYPGLRYTIETADIKLDCQNQDSEDVNNKTITLAAGGANNKYAAIYNWDPPTENVANYYNPTTKALTIPGKVTFDNIEYTLKVIKKETFANKGEYIHSVKFSDGLVQICRRAFYKDTAITNLDFSECTTLKEVSNGVFSDRATDTTVVMSEIASLALPNSLEYLGKYAFSNFIKVTSLSFKANDPSEPSNLKVLGGYAFNNIGSYYSEAKLDVALPCSLNDDAAKEANINKEESSNYNTSNWAAVGPYAFGSRTGNNGYLQRTAVRVVTMDDPTPDQLADNTYTCSISPNAFNRSWYMTKFVASKNLCMVGCDAFKNCEQLREIFLTTTKATAFVNRTGKQYPWGAFKTTDNSQAGSKPETSILGASATVKRDLVIYVDGPAPGAIENTTYPDNQVNGVDVHKWNTDTSSATTSYNVPLGIGIKQNRTIIPTFFNVDFDKTIYWKPTAKVNNRQRAASFVDSGHLPAYVSEYNDGIIVFVEQDGEYTVSKYYCDGSHLPYNDEVDLTNVKFDNFTEQDTSDDIDVSANLTKIGMCAFASANGSSTQKPGLYFKLPSTIEEIGERAFFRHCGTGDSNVTDYGVRVVSYVSGSTLQTPADVNYSTSLKPGFCILPADVTSIGIDAFYNNNFLSVSLGASITRIGAGAFYTSASNLGKEDYQPTANRSSLETITMATNSIFETINNGLYYVETASKKTLLYQAQGNSGSLTIDSGTKAIGMYALSSTKYTTINLNSELTHIYGMAFQNNINLTTVTGGSGVKYISAMATGDEIWDSSLPFDNIDYTMRMNDHIRQLNSRNSAFDSCKNLATLNFKNMTSLVKIGAAAFKDCANLEHMVGTDSYSYYSFDGTNETQIGSTTSDGVLDLSACTNLRVIHTGAFMGCSKIKYFHLPATNGQIYVGQIKEGTSTEMAISGGNHIISNNNGVRVLVGDTIAQAGRNFKSDSANAKAHYSDVAFGAKSGNNNKVYYYMSSLSDCLYSGGAITGTADQNANYWTLRDNKYILIEGVYTENSNVYSNAKKYWALHS